MAPVTQRQLETGWLPDTPVEDTLLRRFVHNQADVNAVTASALGGRHDRTDDVFLADAASPVPYFNQAILARPLTGAGDPVLDVIDGFFETGVHPATVLSIWPTPDLSPRGWSLVGHPAVVVRAPGPIDYEPPEGVDVRVATSPEAFAAAEHVAVDGYPLDDARDLPVGSVFPPSLADTGLVVRLGLLLGPAALFYPPAGFKAHRISGVEEACRGDVEDLITSASPDELDESGVHEITGPLFISRASTGDVAAACGYRCWPNHVAHLSVLTHSTHRREGHARRAAETAISHAIAEHLLPQWRARPEGSRALARRLGLVELGAQLSLEPA